jgi:hypothetical protein
MKRSRLTLKVIAVVALAACAGVALAQAPDWGPPPGGMGGGMGGRAQGGARGARRGAGMQGRAPALVLLVGGENVQTEISNTDDGVKLTIASAEEAGVADLQNRALAGVDRMKQTAERLGERFAQGAPNERMLRRDPLLMLAAGDAEVAAEKTDDGVVVTLTSDDPQTVQVIQEQMPQWVATAKEAGQRRQQGAERRRQMQAARELLANEAVKIEVEETEAGIIVKVTSDDPELAKEVKENLPVYFEAQAEIARRAGQRGGFRQGAGARGPGGQGFGQQGGRGRGRGARGMGGQAGGPPPGPPEF